MNNKNTDTRLEKLVNLILDYSVSLKENDRLVIQFDPAFRKYSSLIGSKAIEKGAEVRYDSISLDPNVLKGFIQRYDFSEWNVELQRRIEISKWCNARIYITCDSNPNYAKDIVDAPKRIAEFNKRVVGPYKEVLYRLGPNKEYEVKWNIVGFPSVEDAINIGMDIKEYEDFVYSATIGNDWKKMGEQMIRIKDAFDNTNEVHIVVPGLTDLKISLKNRGGEICDGKYNMPDGEICYGPVEDSANGYIYFQCPTKSEGLGVIRGIKLKYENGVITEYSAKENQRALDETLKVDEGVKRIGELGIGCNYGIKKPVLETLFDEKIGGTIHLALGDSYKQSLSKGGGLNSSDIHWDIICDLRRDATNLEEYPGGKLYLDGKLVQENGIWRI
ncbi:MAG: aminopeptidase [Candidatus Woesearchaeota archaeon]|jgi:aminopeptidase